MSVIIHNSDFKTLRQAYLEVKRFLEAKTSDTVASLHTKIENDPGCAGDDNYELLEKFVKKYKLNTTGFDYSKHFLSEGELFGSGIVLLQILTLAIIISIWLIKILTLGKLDFTNRQLIPEWHRETLDMTFGDMLSWYLTGNHNLRKHVCIRLNTNSNTPI